MHLCKMELQRSNRAQAHIHSNFEKFWQRISFISQEQGVVAERAHRDSNLLQVEQVLKSWQFS
jgi:hypothetical protein